MKSRALVAVVAALDAAGIDHALIGAMAFPMHGAARATADLDLLVFDRAILDEKTWAPLRSSRVKYEIRRSDDDSDPIVGVVRVAPGSQLPIDVVMPKGSWLRSVLERAKASPFRADIAGARLPVATLPDLLLLKLDAGGPDDLRDVALLLDAHRAEEPALTVQVDAGIEALPRDAQRHWATVKASRTP